VDFFDGDPHLKELAQALVATLKGDRITSGFYLQNGIVVGCTWPGKWVEVPMPAIYDEAVLNGAVELGLLVKRKVTTNGGERELYMLK